MNSKTKVGTEAAKEPTKNSKYIDGINRSVSALEDTVFFFIKRTFDILVGLVGCIFLIPSALIVKICYSLSDDFYPILYSHNRVGKNGKIIKVYKFRSMVPNADEILKQLLQENAALREEWERTQKLKNDPRITKIGKIIRLLSIDEIPQFLNILKGDMSLIGPRPLVIGELDLHNGIHEIYEAMRPGLTGWWACNGRNATTYSDRLKLEYYYIENASLQLDIKCIIKTVAAIITKKRRYVGFDKLIRACFFYEIIVKLFRNWNDFQCYFIELVNISRGANFG